MFDIGFSELLLVFVVGLLILGPERLPTAAKTAGLWVRKIKRSIQSVQSEINAQLDQEEMQRKIKETNERIMRETAQMEQAMAESAATSAHVANKETAEPAAIEIESTPIESTLQGSTTAVEPTPDSAPSLATADDSNDTTSKPQTPTTSA